MNPDNTSANGREISRASYAAITPRLTGKRRKVLEALRLHGPLTANEVAGVLPPTGLSHTNVRSRLRELVDLGQAIITRLVEDPVSGHRVRQYRAVELGEIPPSPSVELRPRRASRAKLEAEIARLAAENEALKSKLSSKEEE